MYDVAQDLIIAFRSTLVTLPNVLRHCSQEQAAVRCEGEGSWSVLEVVCHLRDAEERALERMQAMRDQDNPPLAAYDQAQWAVERDYAGDQLESALAKWHDLRTRFVAELEALTPADWDRPGQHSEIGQITIVNHLIHMVSHDALHLAQIVRQLP